MIIVCFKFQFFNPDFLLKLEYIFYLIKLFYELQNHNFVILDRIIDLYWQNNKKIVIQFCLNKNIIELICLLFSPFYKNKYNF